MTTKTLKIYVCNTAIEASVNDSNTQILNSYRIKKIKDMKHIIKSLRNNLICQVIRDKNIWGNENDYALFNRTIAGMIIEWRAHNLLYALNIKPFNTVSVDLNIGEPWYRKIGYFILSLIYPHW